MEFNGFQSLLATNKTQFFEGNDIMSFSDIHAPVFDCMSMENLLVTASRQLSFYVGNVG